MNAQDKTCILSNLSHAQQQATAMLCAADEVFDAIEDGRSFDLHSIRAEMNEAHAVLSKFIHWSHALVTAEQTAEDAPRVTTSTEN